MDSPKIEWNERTGIHEISGFHDGWFPGIDCRRRAHVLIWCATESKEHYVLKVPGAVHLHLSRFTGGNIISEITVYEARACPLALFAKVSSLEGAYWQKLLMERFNEFVKTQGFLFELATSDGCELSALSDASPREIEVSRECSSEEDLDM
jgi:hypothetical protein